MCTFREQLDRVQQDLSRVLRADLFRLRRWWQRLDAALQRGRLRPQEVQQLVAAVEESVRCRAERAALVPAIDYDPTLPIVAYRQQIAEAIQQHPVVIVCGETGSGKSTQIPKICLEIGRGIAGRIGQTQPRRIAAQTIAARLAQELRSPLGLIVGYKVRFAERLEPTALIKVMTDGVLLAETQSDGYFEQYDTLIIDEAHERSLNVDFLLGYLRRLVPRRPDLRVVITSATLDAARYQDFFRRIVSTVPVIHIPGRGFPIEIRYRPVAPTEEETEPDLADSIRRALQELESEPSGDVLVFLPTERDIRQTARLLRGWAITEAQRRWEILPLYSRLPPTEQQRIFQPHNNPRVVLATNVAESSITVPWVRYVIDTGTARISRYSPRAKIQRLPIEPISRASADQRAGRCGRIGPGVCIRLFSQEDYQARDAFTTPEIRRTNLAAVLLQTKCLKLGELASFPLLDPPRPEAIRDGQRTLFELGAVDATGQLTQLGTELGKFPVDPRVARMILAAVEMGCVEEVLVVAAGLEVPDPRLRPADRQEAADQAHAEWRDQRSDFSTMLKLWQAYNRWRSELPRSQLKALCARKYLSYVRLQEWRELYRQLRRLVEQRGHPITTRPDDYAALHRALLTGLLSGVAFRHQAYEYRGAGNSRFYLWPGSSVFATRPKWIMAAEIVETNRRYARSVAAIEPEWIEELAPHLIEKRHVNPFWSRRRGAAMVHEKVSLFGLPLITQRVVPLGPLDPVTARRMFIEHGLVEGQMAAPFGFVQHNRRLVARVLQWAAKTRDAAWYYAIGALAAFYDERLPRHVWDLASLRAWLPEAERKEPGRLHVPFEQLLPPQKLPVKENAFPDVFPVATHRFPLEYHYEPGSPKDGVIITIPSELVSELDPDQLEWFVPGRIEEKVTALIRSLPAAARRCLVPAPDTARAILTELNFGELPLLKALARCLSRRAGVEIRPADFRLDELPAHLRFRYRLVDSTGSTVLITSDWNEVTRRAAQLQGPTTARPWHGDGFTQWTFGDLPELAELRFGPVRLIRYPTLVDQANSVGLRAVDSRSAADSQLKQGVRRLFVLAERAQLRAHLAWLPQADRLREMARGLMSEQDWERQVMDLLADRALAMDSKLPRTAEAFAELCRLASERLPTAVQQVTALLGPLLHGHQLIHERLACADNPLLRDAVEDMQFQLSQLMSVGFLLSTPWFWLQQYPRYFQAMLYRWDRLHSGGLGRDRQAMEIWLRRWKQYEALRDEQQELRICDEHLVHYRWMLEEYRVALFAQPLGTVVPVSEKRLDAQWEKTRRVGSTPIGARAAVPCAE